MAPLLSGFAGQYNRRHKRSGYVFQNRYKSILCDANSYLLELVRYIHLNPLREYKNGKRYLNVCIIADVKIELRINIQ